MASSGLWNQEIEAMFENSSPWKEEDTGTITGGCNRDISEINDDDTDNIDLVFKDMEFLFNEEFEEESSLVEADIENKVPF
ncbi:hypothetical protein SNE40_014271 [Patella caerulea]|uniref:Uncharacterized protein n=1 Tax=Patella caerulea TaxID=87958 RepID=A0AAN8JI14_PATCE